MKITPPSLMDLINIILKVIMGFILQVTYNRIDGEIDPSSITVSPYK